MIDYIRKFFEAPDNEFDGAKASPDKVFTRLRDREASKSRGFEVTHASMQHFIEYNKLDGIHERLLRKLDKDNFSNLHSIGAEARELILHARMPNDLSDAILLAYQEVFGGRNPVVTVESIVMLDTCPEESFIGLHHHTSNVNGAGLVDAIKHCFASLYSDRAIKYREDKYLGHSKIALSVLVQEEGNGN